jgi:hypothetical protein
MSTAAGPGYFIADPRPFELTAPYTCFLATPAQVAAVSEGDLVQLTFELDPPGKQWTAERMWVTVTGTGDDFLAGRLETKPDEAPMTPGDAVTFRRLDILQIVWKDPEQAPPPSGRREFWERCLVETCVVDGEQPVEYIYREAPEPLGEGDRYPDSGWRLRGRRGDATAEEYDAREVQYVALGLVLNRDDSWLPLIDEPVGSTFSRDFDTDQYVPQE